jgi:segregation and condensation protein B
MDETRSGDDRQHAVEAAGPEGGRTGFEDADARSHGGVPSPMLSGTDAEAADDDAGDAAPTADTEDGDEVAAADGASDERLIAILESVLFAAGEPVTLARLAEVIPGPSRAELRAALAELGARTERERRGIRLVEVAGGWQFRTAPEHAEWVRRLFQQKPWRLTRATLETLAIIAYKQPITRAEIEAIRGVDADSVLASLLTRKLVKILGRKEVIGRPLLYGTTRQFLEVFALKDLGSLPALTEVAPAMPDGVAAGAAAGSDETWSGDDGETDGDGDPAAEAAGGGGDVLASRGGGDDPPGTGEGERGDGEGARDPGDPDGHDPGRR